VSLVRLMEANPTAGIVQTAPAACGLSTLHARAQQFAGRVTGRLFTAGMQYWQLGESHYWGHNAIIRVEPFMKHCALAPLPGKGGLSGDILSHDFVEAALMRRAGYRVWLVNDLEGSYEQQPPNLLEELRRDRRWCQGNLQNARLIAEPGLHGVHRAMLATGAMAYLSAPLWLAFVMLGAATWFSSGRAALGFDGGLPLEMVALWSSTFAMLVLPRLLGVVALMINGEARNYGGGWSLLKGAALEGMLSALQAPVRMVAHSIFVVVALTGIKLDWKSPPREAQAITWKDASVPFAPVFVAVAAALAATLAIDASLAMWLLPVALPLLLAIPLAVATSKPGLGEFIRDANLLTIPEETRPPAVLRAAWHLASQPSRPTRLPEVLSNPALFEVVHQSMGVRQTAHGDRGLARLGLLDRVMVEQDLHAMTPRECMWMLSEPQQISRLRDRLASNAAQERQMLRELVSATRPARHSAGAR
jgi:membrane glycosyltransferase